MRVFDSDWIKRYAACRGTSPKSSCSSAAPSLTGIQEAQTCAPPKSIVSISSFAAYRPTQRTGATRPLSPPHRNPIDLRPRIALKRLVARMRTDGRYC
jgi:hypothetical protein